MESAISDLFAKYGTEGLFVLITAFGAYYFIKARAKVTEADAAEKTADATAVSAVSHTATKLLEHLPAILAAITESQRVLAQTLNEMLGSQQEMAKNAVTSGAAIATHMAASNEAQAAVSAASTLVSTTIDAAQAKILEDLEALKTSIELLTAAIRKQDIVDDDLREGILERLSRLEEFLSKKVEKAKEKQDEKPNEAAPVQTTVELTGLLTSDVPSGDKPGGGTG